MKIGILTFHCAHNYGAVLQCYALQQVLKRLGCTVEVVDYRPYPLKAAYEIFNFRRFLYKNPLLFVKQIISEILSFPHRLAR